MTREEAIKILDPKTCRDALMEFMGGSWNQTQALALIGEAQKMGLAALRAQENTLPNDPLTLEQLREMEGQPVWIECITDPECSCWGYHDEDGVNGYCAYFDDQEYGRVWMAYRHKLESD